MRRIAFNMASSFESFSDFSVGSFKAKFFIAEMLTMSPQVTTPLLKSKEFNPELHNISSENVFCFCFFFQANYILIRRLRRNRAGTKTVSFPIVFIALQGLTWPLAISLLERWIYSPAQVLLIQALFPLIKPQAIFIWKYPHLPSWSWPGRQSFATLTILRQTFKTGYGSKVLG